MVIDLKSEFLISQAVVYKNTPFSMIKASDELNTVQGQLIAISKLVDRNQIEDIGKKAHLLMPTEKRGRQIEAFD